MVLLGSRKHPIAAPMVSERLTAAAKRAKSYCETQNETG